MTIYLEPLDAEVPEYNANLSAVQVTADAVVVTFGRQVTEPRPDQEGRHTARPTVRIILPPTHVDDLLRKLLQQKEVVARIREAVTQGTTPDGNDETGESRRDE